MRELKRTEILNLLSSKDHVKTGLTVAEIAESVKCSQITVRNTLKSFESMSADEIAQLNKKAGSVTVVRHIKTTEGKGRPSRAYSMHPKAQPLLSEAA